MTQWAVVLLLFFFSFCQNLVNRTTNSCLYHLDNEEQHLDSKASGSKQKNNKCRKITNATCTHLQLSTLKKGERKRKEK